MNPTKSTAVKRFLEAKTHADLAGLYHVGMECQVNVAQDGGERVEGDYKGKRWHGWTDGVTTWKSFRIPYGANKDPHYEDRPIRFSLEEHVEGVGLTGWDWQKRASIFVAFDFDAIIGHSEKHLAKLTHEELEEVKQAALNIDWVTVRKSTGGKGLHLYVFFEDPVPTSNHNEHSALARAILGQMAAITGFDFQSRVDICGGNMWVWHRKMADSECLKIVKQGSALPIDEVPVNWRDHVKVVTGRRRKNLPQSVEDAGQLDPFEELVATVARIPLDDEHRKVIDHLRKIGAYWWFDQDHWMLVSHTHWLQRCQEDLGLRGYFETDSGASNTGEQNCFAFPNRRGAWVVRRYTPGVREHASWDQDGNGWTRSYLNKEPDLGTACRAFGGIEHTSGGFVFRDAESAIQACGLLGVHVEVGTPQRSRRTRVKEHADGRLVVMVDHLPEDDGGHMMGWLAEKKKWTRIFYRHQQELVEPEVGNNDDFIRHIISPGEKNEDAGWMLKAGASWQQEPLTHVRDVLSSLGMNHKEGKAVVGACVLRPWKMVNRPFEPEYPGDREWNLNAAQLKFYPSGNDSPTYPTWSKILDHCGQGLNDALKKNEWAQENGIIKGADYLKCWIASVFQQPYEPLPWLFFFGDQNSGKSMFHESLDRLLTRGYMNANAAITSTGNFNEELLNALICVVEEIDLQKNKTAYNKIKELTTALKVLMHGKGKTPYMVRNTMHWIQCANDHKYCPIFPGDTRVTMIHVPNLRAENLIPKKEMLVLLDKEAPDFLQGLLTLEVPKATGRFAVPAIETYDKQVAIQQNKSALEAFIDDRCDYAPGEMIKLSEFFDKFIRWVEPAEMANWTKRSIGKKLPPMFPKARRRKDAQHYIGNIRWRSDDPIADQPKLIINGDYLDPSG